MLRLACAGLCLILAAASVQAQNDPIAERKNAMRAISSASRDGAAIAKGEKPFDAAAVKAVFATYRDSSRKLATSFPDGSQSGNTRAAAKIWEDRAGFAAEIAKFDADAAAGEAASVDLASFRQAFDKATDHCASCHETYRRAR